MECASTACQMLTSALRMKNTEVRWSWMNAPLGEDACTGDCFYYSEDPAERRSYGVNGLPERDDPRSCGK